jgi:hypothetical protein
MPVAPRTGQSNGYMEIMGGVGLRWPVTATISLDGGVSVGAGGGGGVDTGGGALVAARVGARWRVTGRDAVAIGVERMKAPSGHLTVDGLSLSLRHRFGPDEPMTVVRDSVASLRPAPRQDPHGGTELCCGGVGLVDTTHSLDRRLGRPSGL